MLNFDILKVVYQSQEYYKNLIEVTYMESLLIQPSNKLHNINL